MKDKPIRSVLLFLLLYPIVLSATIREELGAIVKATTNKGEGILAKVDTVLMRNWKAAGMKFRFHRSIKGADDYKVLNEKWGTYKIFDVATPGIWYEYKVEVVEKSGDTFFLTPMEPIVGYRPPSKGKGKAMAAEYRIADPFQYRGHVYIDFEFKGENGRLVLPDSAVYHIKYDTHEDKGWMFDLGNGSLHAVHVEVETTQSRIKIKKRLGMEFMNICVRMIQDGGITRFFCTTLDLRKLPNKRPKDIALRNYSPGKDSEAGVGRRSSTLPMQKEDPFRYSKMAKVVPFSAALIRRRSQKQRIMRRVS